MNKAKASILLGGVMAIVAFTSIADSAFAASNKGLTNRRNHGHFQKSLGVSGTATAVSGSTLTVQGSNGTPYTVDASGAKISKLAAPASGGKPVRTDIAVATITIGDKLRIQGTISGTHVTATQITDGWLGGMMGGLGKGQSEDNQTGSGIGVQRQGVGGTVSAVSGSSITLLGSDGMTTYTIDATNAKIGKFTTPTAAGMPIRTDIKVTDIAVGDTLKIQGTLNGTAITATSIMDGKPGMRIGGRGKGQPEGNQIGGGNEMQRQGVNGTVSAISGSTITLLGRDGTTPYTIDASNAKVTKFETPTTTGKPTKTDITVADILVGDSLRVQGTISGNSVTATQITDGLIGGRGIGSGFGGWHNGN